MYLGLEVRYAQAEGIVSVQKDIEKLKKEFDGFNQKCEAKHSDIPRWGPIQWVFGILLTVLFATNAYGVYVRATENASITSIEKSIAAMAEKISAMNSIVSRNAEDIRKLKDDNHSLGESDRELQRLNSRNITYQKFIAKKLGIDLLDDE